MVGFSDLNALITQSLEDATSVLCEAMILRVHEANKLGFRVSGFRVTIGYFGFLVLVIVVHVLGKYMIIRCLDPQGYALTCSDALAQSPA